MSKLWHALAGLYLYVCPSRRSTLITYPIIIIRCFSLAGSSLPLSITSGVSSEGIALTAVAASRVLRLDMFDVQLQGSLALAEGRIAPIVDEVIPLDRAADAYELVASDTTFGKVILDCR